MWTSADTEANRVERAIQAARHPFVIGGVLCERCGQPREHTYHLIACRNCGRRSYSLFAEVRCIPCADTLLNRQED